MVIHDPYKHIGQQLLKFSISYKASGRKIKKFLLKRIYENNLTKKLIEKGVTKAGYRNIDAFLEDIIFKKEIRAIIVIDKITPDLENVVNQLTIFYRLKSSSCSGFAFAEKICADAPTELTNKQIKDN